jgi:hypothetical protein
MNMAILHSYMKRRPEPAIATLQVRPERACVVVSFTARKDVKSHVAMDVLESGEDAVLRSVECNMVVVGVELTFVEKGCCGCV